MDEGFGSELNQINGDPGKQLPMDSASAETRHRSTELYSLLASLVRNRAVSVASLAAVGVMQTMKSEKIALVGRQLPSPEPFSILTSSPLWIWEG